MRPDLPAGSGGQRAGRPPNDRHHLGTSCTTHRTVRQIIEAHEPAGYAGSGIHRSGEVHGRVVLDGGRRGRQDGSHH